MFHVERDRAANVGSRSDWPPGIISTCLCRLRFGKPPETGAVGHDGRGLLTRLQKIHQRGGEGREALGEVIHKSENGSAHAFLLKEMWPLAQLFRRSRVVLERLPSERREPRKCVHSEMNRLD